MEIWKIIEGTKNTFISNEGNVKISDKPKSTFITSNGYVGVHLKIEGEHKARRVHRLVAIAFIPNPENKPEVNHKDGDKFNNHVSNLEWNTPSENQLHAYNVLGKKTAKGMKYNRVSKDQAALIVRLKNEGENRQSIAKKLGFSAETIRRHIKRSKQ